MILEKYISKRLIVVIAVLSLVFAVVGLPMLVVSLVPKTAPINASITVEAGTETVSCDLFKKEADKDTDIKLLTDLSKIDLCKTGCYDIQLSCDDDTYTSVLTIVDTTPPTATPVDNEIYNDQTLDVNAFVTDIKDFSEVSAEFVTVPDFTKVGEQTVEIKLTDTSGNNTVVSAKLSVIKDTVAPVFGKMRDISVRIGETISYKKGVTVTDDRDESVSFSVDKSKVNLQKEGTYTITYTASDKEGNTATATRTVKVLPKLVITQELVDGMAKDILKKIITDGMTQHQKIKTIYDYVRKNMTYVSSPETDIPNAAYVGFTKKRGDCFNYLAMTKLLLDHAGIENKRIERYGGASTHYWLLVNIGTGWYHYDTTPQSIESPYKCFMKTNAEVWAYAKSRKDGRADYYNFKEDLYPEIATAKYTY